MDQIDDTKLALTMLEKFKRKGVPTLELPRSLNDVGFTDEMGKPFNQESIRKLRKGTIKAFSKRVPVKLKYRIRNVDSVDEYLRGLVGEIVPVEEYVRQAQPKLLLRLDEPVMVPSSRALVSAVWVDEKEIEVIQ